MKPYLMSNFPSVRPSLNLQFDSQPTPADMTSHLASVGATFSRASIGTYTDANGVIQEATAGQARPNYSTAGVHEGLLIEEARTNLAKSSEDFSTTDWDLLGNGTGSNPIVTINQAIAPDGTASADKIVFDAGAGTTSSDSSQLNQTVSFSNNTDGTVSIWLKGESGGEQITFRGVGGSTYQLLTLTTEWQRFTTTENSGTNSDAILFGIRQDVSGHGVINSSATVYAWGAQIEQGSFPTSYIPTIPTFDERLSPATFFDSSGVLQTQASQSGASAEGRIDHKYIDGEWVEAGLLLEAQATNLLVQSQDLSTTWATFFTTVTTNQVNGLDGTLTADLLKEDSASNKVHYLSQSGTFSSGTTYTFSTFAKNASGTRYLQLRVFGIGSDHAYTNFNLVNGEIPASGSGGDDFINATIEDVGNGWYRCSMTGNYSETPTGFMLGISNSATAELPEYTGDNTSGFYIWGAQVEEGSQLTSYIKTTTASATRSADVYDTNTKERSADVCYIDGTAFTDFYNDDSGTILAEFNSITDADYPGIWWLNDNTNVRGFSLNLGADADDITFYYRGADAVLQSIGLLSNTYDGSNISVIANYNSSTFRATYDGESSIGSDDITSVYPFDKLTIGMQYAAGNNGQLSGAIKKLIYFPRALSDNELIKLTQ